MKNEETRVLAQAFTYYSWECPFCSEYMNSKYCKEFQEHESYEHGSEVTCDKCKEKFTVDIES